ncbi:MAG TPA: UDP-2,4-diacetamido-2,4,6-trideoxy-beta-L-altropyranose hydrolase [Verrucomicrobiae bacterium]|nr:UDP-2,4-diacetamido-2,4,6-trideoxy-beta-L-altropyranose hydrolase [Verrucomicrobiae bacterium]
MLDSLLLRVDGSARIGTGHVMRCFALAQAWQFAGGRAVFAFAESTPALERRLNGEKMKVELLQADAGSRLDAEKTAALAKRYDCAWVVVDGYQFESEFQRILKQAGLRVLAVDDYGHAGRYYADVVLNQNLHASDSYYRNRDPLTRLLLGPDYVQLRREFPSWRNWQREIPSTGRKLLVTLGGSDPDNSTAKVLEALSLLGENSLEAVVAVGGSNPHYEKLLAQAGALPMPVQVERDVPRMDKWMAWADAAVSSGGTTVWELAFMGLPSIIGQIGPSEEKLVAGLAKLDLFTRLGWFREASPQQIASALSGLLRDAELRDRMSRKARALIDGRGTERVIALLRRTSGSRKKKD